MILVKPSHEILATLGTDPYDEFAPLKLIEYAGRVCYKSEDKITKDSANKFVKMVTERGHHSVLEHSAMTVKFICDRGVSHQLVRHRLCSFSQESTKYCSYKDGVTFVIPPWVDIEPGEYPLYMSDICIEDFCSKRWFTAMSHTENAYVTLLHDGWSPQQARSVLPNSLKTEIVVTANFREWKHIFNLRCSKAAHPQIRELMIPLRDEMIKYYPEVFGV
jgi:thymidylate synthase (FAD)